MIRSITLDDLPMICDIYNYYVINETVTFEELPIDEVEFKKRMDAVLTQGLPWLVYEHENTVIGYAYATPWKTRSAYRYSVEASVYLHKDVQAKGYGSQLYTELLHQLKCKNIHTVIGGVAQPNPKSSTLHEKFSFVKVAEFREVGYKFNRWIDVQYWELIL